VADAAAALSVIQSRTFDGRDPATGGVPLGWQGTGKTRPKNIPTDYTKFVNPSGLQGARLGVTRVGLGDLTRLSRRHRRYWMRLRRGGRAYGGRPMVIDLDAAGFTFASADGEFLVLLFDFRNDVRAYFGTRVGVPVAGGTLQSAIDFDNADADVEMPFFNRISSTWPMRLRRDRDDPQPIFGGLTYNQALAIDHNAA